MNRRRILTGLILLALAMGGTTPAAADHTTTLSVAGVGADYVDLSWSVSKEGALRYDVDQSSDGANWTLIAQIPYDQPKTYRATGLAAGTWHFRIRAIFWFQPSHANTSNTVSAAVYEAFPTPETTGPRVPESELVASGSITSTHDGQVIERKLVTGKIRIDHNNVIVRDVKVMIGARYALNVNMRSDGSCPQGTRFEYVELDGNTSDPSWIPVYGEGCPYVLDRGHIYNVGRSPRLSNDNTVSNTYVYSARTFESAHRGALGNNGGRNNAAINNVLICEGVGCSAAMPMYGDFAPVDGMLVQHNWIATTGGYCVYGGSLDGKPYPDGSNVKFIDNHFSTRYFPTCGRYGVIAGFENNVRGNEWRGNVWAETGQPIVM